MEQGVCGKERLSILISPAGISEIDQMNQKIKVVIKHATLMHRTVSTAHGMQQIQARVTVEVTGALVGLLSSELVLLHFKAVPRVFSTLTMAYWSNSHLEASFHKPQRPLSTTCLEGHLG